MSDESDFVVLVSVILTRWMKEGDSIEQEREIILVFPDDNNPYGLGTAAMPLTLEERGELAV